MTVIELPDEEAAALKAKAASQGLTLEGWLKSLARERGDVSLPVRPEHEMDVVELMRTLRDRVKPDPDGWTTRDYVNFGRR